MSSKVLSSSHGRSAEPIEWGKLKPPPANVKPASSDEQTAKLQAQLAQLQQRHEAEVASAYQRGYSEGETHAKAGPAAEMRTAIERMAQSVRELTQLRPRLRRDAEGDVVRLALAIARRVLRREMSVDPSAMQALAQVALQKIGRQEISLIRVHPDQASAIRLAIESAGVRAEVVSEVTRESGSLIFETNQGLLDASVNAQLEEIERGLTDRLNHND
jgi:flagellar assembly protein FliH